jgi:hypothetical protein
VTNEKGQVVALVVAGIIKESAQNLNFALPINYLRGALRIARTQSPTPVADWQWGRDSERAKAGLSDSPPGRVNDDLRVNWTSLDGIEAFLETEGDEGLRWETKTQYRVTFDASGNPTLERFQSRLARQTGNVLRGRRAAQFFRDELRTVVQLDNQHRITTYGQRTSLHAEVKGASYVQVIDGTSFSYDSAGVSRVERIPLGAYPIELFSAVLGALDEDLPDILHVWFVGTSGIAIPVRTEFSERKHTTIPLASDGTSCEKGARTQSAAVEVVKATFTVGASRYEQQYMTSRPHLAIHDDLKCLRYREVPRVVANEPAIAKPIVPQPTPPAEPEPTPEPPASGAYAPLADRALLTGCQNGQQVDQTAPVFDSPELQHEVGQISLRGTEDACAGPLVILHELRVMGDNVVYDVELIESSLRGWILARFVGRNVLEGECEDRYPDQPDLLAKCTGR